MAMLILTQHTANEWAHSTGLVHAFFGLGNFAVPFFFTCSGFLFFSKLNMLDWKEQKDYYKRWSIRIGKMYLVWSLIYFCFVLAIWISNGFTLEKIINYLHRALVFTTYPTIWFLPALWIGISICYWMKQHIGKHTMWIIIVTLFVIGNFFGSYTNVITEIPAIASFNEWYMEIFITWRNGLFNGVPYVFIGILIAEGYGKKFPKNVSALATVIFGSLFIFEAFCISHYKLSSATDMGFFMCFAIFFMINTLIKTDITKKPIWRHCRNLSMLIFLGQRLFLTAIPSILPVAVKNSILTWPQPYIFLLFVTLTLVFSITVEQLSSKYKFLKILW